MQCSRIVAVAWTRSLLTSTSKAKTMTVQTLSSVTLETIENYRQAATLAVDAYRAGSLRLIGAVNGGIDSVYSRTGKVAPQLTKTVAQLRGDLSDIIVKGVGEVASRTDKVIEASSETAVVGVTKVAKFSARIDNPIVANGLEAAVRLSLPGQDPHGRIPRGHASGPPDRHAHEHHHDVRPH